jgi:hypothetical protein
MIIPMVPMTMATITMTTLPHMSTCTTIVTAIPTGMSTIICTTMSTGMLTYRPEPTVHRSPGALCWALASRVGSSHARRRSSYSSRPCPPTGRPWEWSW